MNHLIKVSLAVSLAAGVTPSVIAQPQAAAARTIRMGISVVLPVTSNAEPMPDADNEDALIVSITVDGRVYFGVNPIDPAELAEKVKDVLSNRTGKMLYIKADARARYASVASFVDAARTAGVEAPALLTTQPDSPALGGLALPKGLVVWVDPSLFPSGPEAIVVQMLSSGQRRPALKINNAPVPWTNLQDKLRQLLQDRAEKVVQVKAEGTLSFAVVVDVIDVCRSTGAKVVLATQNF